MPVRSVGGGSEFRPQTKRRATNLKKGKGAAAAVSPLYGCSVSLGTSAIRLSDRVHFVPIRCPFLLFATMGAAHEPVK